MAGKVTDARLPQIQSGWPPQTAMRSWLVIFLSLLALLSAWILFEAWLGTEPDGSSLPDHSPVGSPDSTSADRCQAIGLGGAKNHEREAAHVLRGITVQDHLSRPCGGAEVGWWSASPATGESPTTVDLPVWTTVGPDGNLLQLPPSQFVVHVKGLSGVGCYDLAQCPVDSSGLAVVLLPEPVLSGVVLAPAALCAHIHLSLGGQLPPYSYLSPSFARLCELRFGALPGWPITIERGGQFSLAQVAAGESYLTLGSGFRFEGSRSEQMPVLLPATGLVVRVDAPLIISGKLVAAAGSDMIGENLVLQVVMPLPNRISTGSVVVREGAEFAVPIPTIAVGGEGGAVGAKFLVEVYRGRHVVGRASISPFTSNPCDLGVITLVDMEGAELLEVAFRLLDEASGVSLAQGIAQWGEGSQAQMERQGVIVAKCGRGDRVTLSSPGYASQTAVVTRSGTYNIALESETSLDVYCDLDTALLPLRLDVRIPVDWQASAAVRAAGRRRLGTQYRSLSSNGSTETIGFAVPHQGPVRLSNFLLTHAGQPSVLEMPLELLDGYGNVIVSKSVNVKVGSYNEVRLRSDKSPSTLRGRVVDSLGAAIKGAQFMVGRGMLSRSKVELDDEGRFSCLAYWDENPEVSVTAPGYVLAAVAPSNQGEVAYVMARSRSLVVDVRDSTGGSVSASVHVSVENGRSWTAVSSDIPGVFEFAAVPDMALVARAEFGGQKVESQIPAGISHFSIKIQ